MTVRKQCERSGVWFDVDSARVKIHPTVREWTQAANQEGWYSACTEAIAQGKQQGFQTLEQFEPLVEAAKTEAPGLRAQKDAEQRAIEQQRQDVRQRDALVKETLKRNGYRWHSSEVLDEAQGETGERSWTLYNPAGQEVTVADAMRAIYADPDARVKVIQWALGQPHIGQGIIRSGLRYRLSTGG